MNKLKKYKLLLLIVISLLCISTKCGKPYFVIKNDSDQELIITFKLNKLQAGLSELVISEIWKRMERDFSYYTPEERDSIENFFKNEKNKHITLQYYKDSVSLESIFEWQIRISDLDHVSVDGFYEGDENESRKYDVNIRMPLRQYYNRNPEFIDSLMNKFIIHLYLPPNFTFYTSCEACGDCSCDVDVPGGELYVKAKNKVLYTINENNFKKVMKNRWFNLQDRSYVLKIKNSDLKKTIGDLKLTNFPQNHPKPDKIQKLFPNSIVNCQNFAKKINN